jgi:hypothetical protein
MSPYVEAVVLVPLSVRILAAWYQGLRCPTDLSQIWYMRSSERYVTLSVVYEISSDNFTINLKMA